ncbi:MAG: hypothetical protein V1860_00415 [bacterium]
MRSLKYSSKGEKMIKITEKNPMLQKALQLTCKEMDITEGAMININEIGTALDVAGIPERPLIFYSFSSELSVQRSFNHDFPFFYMKDVGFIKMPFRKETLMGIYNQIVKGEKIENRAMILASGVVQQQNLAGVILHDQQHIKEHEFLKRAEIEFGFTGDVEAVATKLSLIKEGMGMGGIIKNRVGDDVINGVFCDIDWTILCGSEINKNVLKMLKKYGKHKAITLWTGGSDLEKKRQILWEKGIIYPITSKYLFQECYVEIVIDDFERSSFEKDYKIFAREYIKVNSGDY